MLSQQESLVRIFNQASLGCRVRGGGAASRRRPAVRRARPTRRPPSSRPPRTRQSRAAAAPRDAVTRLTRYARHARALSSRATPHETE